MLWRRGAHAHNHAGAPEVIVCRTESWTLGTGISMQQHTILIENYILMNHRRDLQTNNLSISTLPDPRVVFDIPQRHVPLLRSMLNTFEFRLEMT
ncbi:hypothetical protein GUITHDRAFT_155649 [Guillardia theta CCMP2712]|uniref:Uncharacterized protein n=1 Tax=Guillardia theta (strain CCMP2712) TaxID=905079 RepID=L1IFV7_GUITC|nr:hypothetical protein GUITHDRAFT_155649 [Guillardia theta CCMP2712]EKX34769.1 hypothetical protein GUITHDRAFT_155649 [Guillardia theta CCMP2712]|eukprot:XP_005821749.1 hypothetical protein GUITHDRAFT_155649 [Guillardia theta CCMP2712]